jgi:uncharacterized protein (TIGR02679 family)
VNCSLCDGSCADERLAGLLSEDLTWLWTQLADAADRRGDQDLLAGTVSVTPPDNAAARAAATGLLGRRHIHAGRAIRVDLSRLATALAPMTPGALAAHGAGRRLALRALSRASRVAHEERLRAELGALVPGVETDEAWAALRRARWVRRLIECEDGTALVTATAGVIARLPAAGDPPIDRRILARAATGSPHGLDSGRPVAALVLAVLGSIGRVPASAPTRVRWAAVGVAYDDITGGLTVVGITPVGWSVPPGEPVTLPPRVLASCDWPQGNGTIVFVTENPSVLGAATDISGAYVICTSGTPSQIEVDALGRLDGRGWRLLVRADFDDAGINHVNAVLTAAPNAEPWRMSSADYLRGVEDTDVHIPLRVDLLGLTPWDPGLGTAMELQGIAVYEEDYMDDLVADIADTTRRGGTDLRQKTVHFA